MKELLSQPLVILFLISAAAFYVVAPVVAWCRGRRANPPQTFEPRRPLTQAPLGAVLDGSSAAALAQVRERKDRKPPCAGTLRPGDLGSQVCDKCGFTWFGAMPPEHDAGFELPGWMRRKQLRSIQAEAKKQRTSDKYARPRVVSLSVPGTLEHDASCECDDCAAGAAFDAEMRK
jgi:hypothetical protein